MSFYYVEALNEIIVGPFASRSSAMDFIVDTFQGDEGAALLDQEWCIAPRSVAACLPFWEKRQSARQFFLD